MSKLTFFNYFTAYVQALQFGGRNPSQKGIKKYWKDNTGTLLCSIYNIVCYIDESTHQFFNKD